jgi:hypothetical protein
MDKSFNEEAFRKEGPHKYFGIELNNFTWSLLSNPNRSPEEDELMLHAAHGSYFHWMQNGTVVHRQRGEWLISRVYSMLNIPERAFYHARKCMQYTQENLGDMEDFDIAYADEAMARALACNGNLDEAKRYLKSAKEKGDKISDIEAKKYFTGDLNTEPWYGANEL